MEQLKSQFTVGRRSYSQIKRQGDVAIFEILEPKWKSPGFEVIIVQKRKAEKGFGKEYPDRELYPNSEMWGYDGWSPDTLEAAEAKFQQVIAEREARQTPIGSENSAVCLKKGIQI